MASLEITQSSARRQTIKGNAFKFQCRKVANPVWSTDFPGSAGQILQQFADGKAGLKHLNHLFRANAYLRAESDNLGDCALQRLLLGYGKRLRKISTCGRGQLRLCRHSHGSCAAVFFELESAFGTAESTPALRLAAPYCGYHPPTWSFSDVMALTSICDGNRPVVGGASVDLVLTNAKLLQRCAYSLNYLTGLFSGCSSEARIEAPKTTSTMVSVHSVGMLTECDASILTPIRISTADRP